MSWGAVMLIARRLVLVCSSTALVLCTSGCYPHGLIYTDITRPAVLDMNRTVASARTAELSAKKIKEPFSGLNLYVEWNSRAIGDAAKQAGFKKIHYADIRTVSVLGGIWERKTIFVRGE